ncbi:MAG: YdcF family protein [Bacilli bacterium]|nr:YdcF family protein [Bacilli bacterium]
MKRDRIIYLAATLLFIIVGILIIANTNLNDNVNVAKFIQIIIILFLIRISYGCSLYIKKQFIKNRYSYGIVMNIGLLLFININILRQINLLIVNWNLLNIKDIYNNTLNSFSYFAMLTLPCIIIFAIYSIITNVVLIKKEGYNYQKLLGIFLGTIALMGLFGTQLVYLVTKNIFVKDQALIIKKLADVMINVTLSYLYTIIIATLYCNIMASRHIPTFDKDYVIILGCRINKDGSLPPLLKSRVDKGIEFAKHQKELTGKNIIFIPSGGQGTDEKISEAEAMKNYLVQNKIKESNIVIENKSTNTLENMKYSNSIIISDNKDAKISFVTTNYHVFRCGVIAAKCGIDCEGMGSTTKWYFYTNALIREFIANLVLERKKHIALIIIMNISAIVFVLIGYYNDLII